MSIELCNSVRKDKFIEYVKIMQVFLRSSGSMSELRNYFNQFRKFVISMHIQSIVLSAR